MTDYLCLCYLTHPRSSEAATRLPRSRYPVLVVKSHSMMDFIAIKSSGFKICVCSPVASVQLKPWNRPITTNLRNFSELDSIIWDDEGIAWRYNAGWRNTGLENLGTNNLKEKKITLDLENRGSCKHGAPCHGLMNVTINVCEGNSWVDPLCQFNFMNSINQ